MMKGIREMIGVAAKASAQYKYHQHLQGHALPQGRDAKLLAVVLADATGITEEYIAEQIELQVDTLFATYTGTVVVTATQQK